MKDKTYYIDQFTSLSKPVKPFYGRWYNGKFEWRIAFHFKSKLDTCNTQQHWTELRKYCKSNNLDFRPRSEFYTQTIFTKDPRVLDYIIQNENYHSKISFIQYTADEYFSEFSKKDDISTDVKFVKDLPDYPYQVVIGNLGWKDHQSIKQALVSFLVKNRELYFFKNSNFNLIEKWETELKKKVQPNHYFGLFDGFNFFAKDFDDIMMLHYIAAGKIKKVFKLVKKEKKSK